MQGIQPGMLTKGMRLLHDIARPHVTLNTKAILDKFGWYILPHPPTSPDLAPLDYHLFNNLEKYGWEKVEFRQSEDCSEGVLGKRGGWRVL